MFWFDALVIGTIVGALVIIAAWEYDSISQHHDSVSTARRLQRVMRSVEDAADENQYRITLQRDHRRWQQAMDEIREAALDSINDVDDFVEVDHNGREYIVSRLCR